MSRWHVQLHITFVERDISTYSTANPKSKKQKYCCFNFKTISGNYDKYSTRFLNYRNCRDQNKNTL